MNMFAKNEIVVLLLSLALMLGMAKILGELFMKIKLPSVIGEIIAGIIIGPTILGRFAPHFYTWLFPTGTKIHTSLEAFILLGLLLLLLIAGLEVDLSSVMKQGKSVILVSLFSITIPFGLGATLGGTMPSLFGSSNNITMALFIGIALSITALPIIAKILIDLKLFRSDFGMIILTAAMINDLVGWLIFSIIIQIIETGSINSSNVIKTVTLTIGFTIIILTLLRYLINHSLPWIQNKSKWPGGVISFIIVIGLILASLAEAIGIHAIFGAFLAGIAIGDSPHIKEHTKDIINQFINNIFSPLFFVSIGLRIDFIHNFNLTLSLLFIVVVIIGKMSSTVIAGKLTKMKLRESLALGSGMSASGAMGIILGLIGLEYKVINSQTFEAIVIMAVFTSLLSGPLIKFFLKPEGKLNLLDILKPELFIPNLTSRETTGAIQEMAFIAAKSVNIDAATITSMVMEREQIMSTGIGNTIAVPHARIPDLKKSFVIIGKSSKGIDFNAPDGKPAKLIFMILTPQNDQESQIYILSELSNIFNNIIVRENAIASKSYSEFVASIEISATLKTQKA